MKTQFLLAILLLNLIATPAMAHVQEGYFFEDEEWFHDELEYGNEFIDGIFYSFSDFSLDDSKLTVTSKFIYDDGFKLGGYYLGDMTVPTEVYGFNYEDRVFKVTEVRGIYKNGLTSLYLPETIERIYYTIESCRFLEKVQLNNSLKVLNGVKNCPVLSDCPLPLSLEEIGDGYMSGIAITESDFPQSLTTIGQGVFCDNPKLERLSLGNLVTMGDSCFRNLPMLKEIIIPETLQSISDGSFFNCKSLVKVTLPSSPVLSEGIFNKCPAINEVLVYAEAPYDFPDNCMADIDKSKCTLYVPEGSERLYANADGWKEFGKIVPSLKAGSADLKTDNEWRAFTSHGKLIVDSTSDDQILILNTSGQLISTVRRKGRCEITLPSGIYIIRSQGKSLKVII